MKPLLNFAALAGLTIAMSLMWLTVPSAHATDYYIAMTADGFDPDYLTVTLGDHVIWVNEDYDYYDDHSTVSYTYPWDSGPVSVGWGVELDTAQTGTFDYVDDVGYSGSGTLVINPAVPPTPTATLISAPNAVDMVYDAGRDILYITSGSTVLRYQLGAGAFLSPFQLSGSLKGIDLSPDGNTLMVADSSASATNVWVHLVNLVTGQTNRAYFPNTTYGESGSYAVAYGGDGAALITFRYPGSGWVALRRYDPASGKTTIVDSFIPNDSMVSSSGDGSTIIVAEADDSAGPIDLYDVTTRAILRTGGTSRYNYECAASRDGSLFALPTYSGTFIYDRNFNQVTNIGGPIGAAFHPAADAVFFPMVGTTYVQAYSTTTWQMLEQYNFQTTFQTPGNQAFTNGRIRVSPDGQVIFVTVSGGVGYVRSGLSLPLTHRLVVAGSPAPYGVPAPVSYGTYWLADGTSLTVSVPAFVDTNGTEFVSTGWAGTGSAAGSGTSTSASFTLTANSTLTWNWAPLAVSANVQSPVGGRQVVLQWPSVAGKSYDVLRATNLHNGFTPLATNLAATPPKNTYQSATGNAGTAFYRVRVR